MRVSHAITALMLCLACVLEACGSQAVPDLAPAVIVERSAEAMGNQTGFHFLIERTGAPAFLSEQQSISLRRVEGDFVAPDQARAAVRVIAPGVVLDVQAISLGGRYWETNPVSGLWQEFPSEQGFNPAILFEPETGIPELLRADLRQLVLVGVVELENLPGVKLYEIEAMLDGERINRLSYGLIGPGTIDVRLWIEPDTFLLQRLSIEEPGTGEGEPTLWTVDLWDFGITADIRPPELR